MSSHTYSLLLFVVLISVSSACHSGSLKKLVAGETAYVCLHLGNTTKAYAFNLKVDKMERLTIKNDSIFIIVLYFVIAEIAKEENVFFRVTCDTSGMRNGSRPLFKVYKDGSKYYPLHTAIIHLKDGVLTGITYDDTDKNYCKGICDNACDDISYYLDDDKLTVVNKGYYQGYGCPMADYSKLQVYIVWTGTDKDGVQLTSAGSRFSRFSQYGGKKMYEKIIEAADN